MTILSSLPEGVCMDILSLWCLSKDLAFLDSAFCSKVERKWLVENIFRSVVFTLNERECLTSNKPWATGYGYSVFNWIQLRKLKPKNVALNEFYFDEVIHWDLIDLSRVSVLYLKEDFSYYFLESRLIDFINRCSMLRNLGLFIVSNFIDSVFSSIEPAILEQLESLDLKLCNSNLSRTDFLHLNTVSIPKLSKFTLYTKSALLVEQDVCDLIKSKHSLTSIRIDGIVASDVFLREVRLSCKQLKEFCLSNCNIMSLEQVFALQKTFPFMSHWVLRCPYQCVIEFFAKSRGKILSFNWSGISQSLQEKKTILEVVQNVTGLSLMAFVECCPSVEAVELIAKENPSLEILFLSGSQLQVDAVILLLKECHSLVKISFHSSQCTSDEWVRIFRTANKLESLSFTRCKSITSETLVDILHCNPQLKKVEVDGVERARIESI